MISSRTVWIIIIALALAITAIWTFSRLAHAGGGGYPLYLIGSTPDVEQHLSLTEGNGGSSNTVQNSVLTLNISNVTGYYNSSRALEMRLFVDTLGPVAGNVIQAALSFDFEGDGMDDETLLFGAIAVNDTLGFQEYPGQQPVTPKAQFKNLTNGKITLKVWNITGKSHVMIRMGASSSDGFQSIVTIPYDNVQENVSKILPSVTAVESTYNQVAVLGSNIWAPGDKPEDMVITFTRKSDGKVFEFKGGYQSRSYGYEIGGYWISGMSLATGFLPSVFEGKVQISTTRGSSNVLDFVINDTSCKTNIAGIASLLGGNDSEWASSGQGRWTFTRSSTVRLFSPYTGKLTVDGAVAEPGKFVTVATSAVYECGSTTTNPPPQASACPQVQISTIFLYVYGDVNVDGVPAPAGSIIEARNGDGVTVGCFKTERSGEHGLFYIYGAQNVSGYLIPGMKGGELVKFYVNGRLAVSNPSLNWANEWFAHKVDLNVSSAPTASLASQKVFVPLGVSKTGW